MGFEPRSAETINTRNTLYQLRGVFKRFCKRTVYATNTGKNLYKTNRKRMADHYCTLCINIHEIHKPVLLQFWLLSGVLIDTALKMVRKWSENDAEIRVYIKSRYKLGLSIKSIHDEIRVVYGDKQMLFSTVYRWFSEFRAGLGGSVDSSVKSSDQ